MIKKITTGKHAGEWSVRIQPRKNGKRISWPEKFVSSKRQALITENRMWADFQSGLDVNVAKAVFADEFQKYVNKRAKSISPVTLKSWQDSANAFKKYFGKTRVNQITTALVSDYAHDYVTKHQTTVSNSSTIAKRLVHMRNFFKSLQGRFIKENPVPERALKTFFKQSDFSVTQECYIFTPEELSDIRKLIFNDLKEIDYLPNWIGRLAILIESYTGMRIGELQALKFENIVHSNNVWTFKINDSWSDYTKSFNGSLKARPKGYSRTLVPVPEKVIKLLQVFENKQNEYLQELGCKNTSGLVFLNLHDYRNTANNIPITQHGINDMLKLICKRLDIKSGNKRLSAYSFRHTICTNLANTPKMSYPWAAERMGHSLQMFMKTYVGIDPDIDKQMNVLWTNKMAQNVAQNE
ncbi:site-specific integrase [Lactobacillus sp. ESL0261]|uniref:tyrosine-type recombinase/integrase n=1 Tax=Lactobacillus sp. ESL0261 TaxID=2069348 RepID=UPI000EFD17A8|nr:site-specific integrase [Lactobacillus sp. ESL0261]RMC55940.1 site-specific integrase [Lactobacillus sp. ESL0261]